MGHQFKELLQTADMARKNAYAPYSNYRVGCAVLLDDGSIIQGINVENASFGATICAERTAMGTIITAGKQKNIVALAVVTSSSPPASPCGLCRQYLSEFLAPTTPIILGNEQGESVTTNLSELLPLAFDSSFLRK